MKFKRFLLPIFLFAVIFTAMAFTLPDEFNTVKNTKVVDPVFSYYFIYIGPSPVSDFSEYTDADNYVLLPGGQSPYEQCESGLDEVCMVLVERFWNGFEWKPDFQYNSGYGSAYWGLYNFFISGIPATNTVILKGL
ncbi:hypothetical protein [Pedobacter ginsengisoli]|uniref:hypothetical protein n=1 Tax=Pedobacter ginsengisoli TaxID=363852 RepID=UPI00254E9142|nr:hypothetical protein [Pedobacter ginsengisoli]